MPRKLFILFIFMIFTGPSLAQEIDKKEIIKFIDQKIIISSKSNECVKDSYTPKDLENCLASYFKSTKDLNSKYKGAYTDFKKIIMSGGEN